MTSEFFASLTHLFVFAADMMPVLQGMLPNTTVFEFLDKGMMMGGNDFKKRIRRMRKPNVSSFVVIANTELMANLTEVVSIHLFHV